MQVHQMISTVTSKLDPQYGVIDALKNNFSDGKHDWTQNLSDEVIDQLEE
jgi:para-aminobenzoate synthetase component 1